VLNGIERQTCRALLRAERFDGPPDGTILVGEASGELGKLARPRDLCMKSLDLFCIGSKTRCASRIRS
jgi:hypothetical protein